RLGPVALIAEFKKAQLAALERLGVEVDRHGETAIGDDRFGIVAMAVQLAAARALIATDAQPLAPGDRVLIGALDLGKEPTPEPALDEIDHVGLDQPMVDAVAAAVFRNPRLVIGGHVVVPVLGLDEDS